MSKVDNPWKIVDREVREYNDRQYNEMYRSTNFTINCLDNILSLKSNLSILDVGCSAGANLYHIVKKFPNHNYVGIDINKYFLNQAVEKYRELNIKNTSFINLDFKSYNTKHDIIGSSQFLEVLDYNEGKDFQKFCFDNSKLGVFFTAMFSERLIDTETYMHDYTFSPKKKVPHCIYSIPKLVELAENKGFKLIKNEKFIININIIIIWL